MLREASLPIGGLHKDSQMQCASARELALFQLDCVNKFLCDLDRPEHDCAHCYVRRIVDARLEQF
jgi:hypothetical protein